MYLDHSCSRNFFTVQIGGGAPILLNGYINLCGRADNAQARLFDGKLAHLALFNRFLTATQIRNLYQAYTSNSASAAPGRPAWVLLLRAVSPHHPCDVSRPLCGDERRAASRGFYICSPNLAPHTYSNLHHQSKACLRSPVCHISSGKSGGDLVCNYRPAEEASLRSPTMQLHTYHVCWSVPLNYGVRQTCFMKS